MRNKLSDLLHHRRLKQMELVLEHDPVACECLRAHIRQIDDDIRNAATVTVLEVPAFDELEEVTQVMPTLTMYETVYGGNS